jgi:hypothetical protein
MTAGAWVALRYALCCKYDDVCGLYLSHRQQLLLFGHPFSVLHMQRSADVNRDFFCSVEIGALSKRTAKIHWS